MPVALMFGGSEPLAIPGFESRDRSYREWLTKALWFRDLGRIRRRLCLCAIFVCCDGGQTNASKSTEYGEVDGQKGKFMDFVRIREVRAPYISGYDLHES